MSDDRYAGDANEHAPRPYLAQPERRPWHQDGKRRHVTGEEILEWVKRAFPDEGKPW